MSITLNYPDALRTDDQFFRSMKSFLRDQFIWNTGQVSVCAYSNQMQIWTGSTEASRSGEDIKVYLGDSTSNTVADMALVVSGVFVQADGTFQFAMGMNRGINKIIIEIDEETKTIYLAAYNWAIIMTAFSEEYTDWKSNYDQVKRNNILLSSVSNLDPDLRFLYKNFGAFTDIKKLPSQTVEEYNTFIGHMFEAYEDGDMYGSLIVPISDITESSVFVQPWRKQRFMHFDPRFKIRVQDAPSLTVGWTGGLYDVLYNNYELLDGSTTLPPSTVNWMYVDSEMGADGYSLMKISATEPGKNDLSKTLAWVQTNSTCVTYIYGGERLNVDAMLVSDATRQGYLDVIVRDTPDSLEKTAIELIVKQNIPAYGRGFIYYSSGEIGRT